MPANLLFDQLKAVIVDDERGDRRAAAGETPSSCASPRTGTSACACRPYRAQTKGKVERPIGYVRQGFFYGRTFLNDADLNAQALSWLAQTANRRLHRTTAEAPRLPLRTRRARRAAAPGGASVSVVGRDGPRPSGRGRRNRRPCCVERRPLAWYDRLTGVAR
ncbi:MAG: transposase [Proteobacteria bacterium]|nr:transposase [Pseudomonadota bacterium]